MRLLGILWVALLPVGMAFTLSRHRLRTGCLKMGLALRDDPDFESMAPRNDRFADFESMAPRNDRLAPWQIADGVAEPSARLADAVAIALEKRERARRAQQYDDADGYRKALQNDLRVHIDDGLRWWWPATTRVPESVRRARAESGAAPVSLSAAPPKQRKPPKPWTRLEGSFESGAVDEREVVELLDRRDKAKSSGDDAGASAALKAIRALGVRVDGNRKKRVWWELTGDAE